jgi:hypothetical protein
MRDFLASMAVLAGTYVAVVASAVIVSAVIAAVPGAGPLLIVGLLAAGIGSAAL